MILVFVASALAGGIHAGIPLSTANLSDVSFVDAQTGWNARAGKGQVRAYVGTSEADAIDWLTMRKASFTVPLQACVIVVGDECYTNGPNAFVFRDGNVGVVVQGEGAWELSRQLVAAIEDGPAWPAAPEIVPLAPGVYEVKAPPDTQVTFDGGLLIGSDPLRFRQLPTQLVAWDAWGRAAVLQVSEAAE